MKLIPKKMLWKEMKYPEEVWFHKYRIIRQLGSGGNSEVFLATHEKLKCFRAIKRIPRHLPYYEQLMNEAYILKDLKHPNIPVIYDIEETQMYGYIIEEYIEGDSLKAYRLDRNEWKEEYIIDYSLQICKLLQYLHENERPIIYLDLKPDNIIVSQQTLKLIDFGSAVYEEEAKKRKFSQGTIGYAAPEQYKGTAADQRSDIYSIGMLIFFMATGQTFTLDSADYSNQYSFVQPDLKKIAEKCLKNNSSERYQTISQLENKLLELKKADIKNKKVEVSSPTHKITIAVAGSQSRIGTTHMAKVIFTWFSQKGYPVTYHNKTDLISTNTSARIVDLGVLTMDCLPAFFSAEYQILIAGTKEWEWKYTLRCMDLLKGCKKTVILFNFTDGNRMKKRLKEITGTHCMNIPYQPDPYGNQNSNGMKVILDQIFVSVNKNRNQIRKSIWAKNQWQDKRIYKASNGNKLVIGLAGTHKGSGVTHLSIALAQYTHTCLHLNTAVVERSGHNDFFYIQKNHEDKKDPSDDKKQFTIDGITYFRNVEAFELDQILNRKNHCFIIDFGCYMPKIREEYSKCNIKIVMCNLSEWKREYLNLFAEQWEGQSSKDTCKYFSFAGGQTEQIPITGKKVEVEPVGYLPNPFALTESVKALFGSLF